MNLPQSFLEKIQYLLCAEEYASFLESYSFPVYRGFRINTLKTSVAQWKNISPFRMNETVPWTSDGFYLEKEEFPGQYAYYHAGLYYIQEPSAMFPATVLSPSPGENVLDLCAAPGGKTVQLAAFMQNKGILIANEINETRAKALVKNVELSGIKNCTVTNASSQALAKKMPGFFDKILVDAPCSGEGMFKKDNDAVKSWNRYRSEEIAKLQSAILDDAHRMLKPGGQIVYSTCTFSPEENETVIASFLRNHPDYSVLEIKKTAGISDGRPDWVCLDDVADSACSPGGEFDCLRHTARLWPHKIKGEGHFTALLQKISDAHYTHSDTDHNCTSTTDSRHKKNMNPGKKIDSGLSDTPPEEWTHFETHNLTASLTDLVGNSWRFYTSKPSDRASSSLLPGNATPHFSGGRRRPARENKKDRQSKQNLSQNIKHLYLLPPGMPDLSGIKVVKQGWYLGECKSGQFTPSHSLLCSLKQEHFQRFYNAAPDSEAISRYLKGETPDIEIVKHIVSAPATVSNPFYFAMCISGFPVGWVKASGPVLKNLYPKGWRKFC